MKKLSFNKLERKNNSTGGFDYIIRSVKPHTEGLTELSNSFIENGFQFDNIDISNLDSQTSLIVSISVIDMDDSTLLQYVRDVLNKECYFFQNCSSLLTLLSCNIIVVILLRSGIVFYPLKELVDS